MSDAESASSRSAALRWLAILIVAVAALVAYLDMRSRIIEVASRAGAGRASAGNAPARMDAGPSPDASLPIAPPSATEPEWQCTGTIPRAQVLETVGRHGQTIFDCYAQLRNDRPEATGTIELRLLVRAEGVVEAQVRGPLQEPRFHSCVQRSLAAWRFAPPTGGDCAVVSVPFGFRSDQ
jgi:hypothetical protein